MGRAYKTKYTKEVLSKGLDNSDSWRSFLEGFGLKSSYGSSRTKLKDLMDKYDLDYSRLYESKQSRDLRLAKLREGIRTPDSEVFVENSKTGTSKLYKRLLRLGWIPKCRICATEEWQGRPLRLHVDHINGVNDDHRLDNLRFLCPNCHSQTDTFSGKNFKKKYHCIECTKEITKHSKSGLCLSCFNKNNVTTVKPDKEELVRLLLLHNFSEVGKIFNVSGKTVRNWCLSYGLSTKIRDYKES